MYFLAGRATGRTYGCALRQLEGEPFPLHQPVDAAVSVAGAAEVAQPTAASADERCGGTQMRGGVGARQVTPWRRYRCLQQLRQVVTLVSECGGWGVAVGLCHRPSLMTTSSWEERRKDSSTYSRIGITGC